jgi:hypothetical protein
VDGESRYLHGARAFWRLDEDPSAQGFDKAGFWIWGLFEEPKYPFMFLQLELNQPIPLATGEVPAGIIYGQVPNPRTRKTHPAQRYKTVPRCGAARRTAHGRSVMRGRQARVTRDKERGVSLSEGVVTLRVSARVGRGAAIRNRDGEGVLGELGRGGGGYGGNPCRRIVPPTPLLL